MLRNDLIKLIMMSGVQENLEAMPWLRKPITRARYLVFVCPLLVIQYTAALLPRFPAYFRLGREPRFPGTLLEGSPFTAFICVIGVVVFSCTTAIGCLSTRRAATLNAHTRAVTLSVVPWIQLPAILYLAFAEEHPERKPLGSLLAVRGALWGLGIAIACEIVFTLVLGEFGIALFVGSPFVVGLVTSYFATRDGDAHPLIAAQQALVLASLVLFGFAFEGLICLLMAYPLASLAALIGGLLGLGLARLRASSSTALSSIALMPLLLAIETAEPPRLAFHDTRSVEISAPPDAVWEAIVHMGRIESAPAAPFGWGLAYPVAGRIDGSGVGAVRLGVFSTGTAYERVTRWQPGRELWFDVLSDPPMMRETNPFGPVHSTHLEGYFATRDARFTLAPLPGGRTRLTLATDHVLQIGPTSYFGMLAHWAVSENKRRVLAHFKDRAEREVSAGRRPL